MKENLKQTLVSEKVFNHYPENISFKYDWRKYQKRVLDELKEHLEDDHLHIIAPPGSGKTVLGLEVALRINKPTLILAPTVAIRNQWIQRFCELFLRTERKPDWISRDIKDPKFLTVATYQALHAACSGNQEEETLIDNEKTNKELKTKVRNLDDKTEKLIRLLKRQKIGTIVVDEAHHLQNAWWQSLTKIKNGLNPTIVGLTATPPYDVSHAEWSRYIELNGPVDTEISVPELVVEGDLCPHQDYIFFTKPTMDENQKIDSYRNKIQNLFEELKEDQTLIRALENHPIFTNPNENLEWIYTNLEFYSATLIFLNSIGKEITRNHLEIIGNKDFKIPELNYEWIEILLTFYLFKDPEKFEQYKEHQENLINKLKKNGAIERSSVNFRNSYKINRFLRSSTSKLGSIDQIVDFEHDHLKQNLRMVILTDYIRKEFLVNEAKNDLKLNKIGVLPIFEQLRRGNKKNIKLGVLTGSLIIIPVSAFEEFKTIASQFNVENLSTLPLPYDNQFLQIISNEKLKHDVVHIVTQVFQKGYIEVLIGTKSLLGEGWDAPSINSLILASFVGSYVMSNQMRGRAIRTEKDNIDKTSNIWHLACIDPTVSNGGNEIELLERRFKTFVGVSNREETGIENGIERLNLPDGIKTAREINRTNNQILRLAGERDLLKEKWRAALSNGTSLIEEIKIPFPKDKKYKEVKSLYYNRTIKYIFGMLGSGLLGFGFEALQGLGRAAKTIRSTEDLTYWLMFIGGTGILLFGNLAYNAFKLFLKYRDISKDLHQIGEALLESLIKIGAIQTDYAKLTVLSNIDSFGAIYCHLEGGTTFEKSLFIKSLQEIIGTVDNPRYLIIRKNSFLKIFSQKDYHSVPDILGRKKSIAEYFERNWERFVGSCELIYTRTVEGRQMLLKSKVSSLASEFEDKTERINKWR